MTHWVMRWRDGAVGGLVAFVSIDLAYNGERYEVIARCPTILTSKLADARQQLFVFVRHVCYWSLLSCRCYT